MFDNARREEMDRPPTSVGQDAPHPFDQIRSFGENAEREAVTEDVARRAGAMLVEGVTDGVARTTKGAYDSLKAGQQQKIQGGKGKGKPGQSFTNGSLSRRAQFGATPKPGTENKVQ
jgi:hypothetical protein